MIGRLAGGVVMLVLFGILVLVATQGVTPTTLLITGTVLLVLGVLWIVNTMRERSGRR